MKFKGKLVALTAAILLGAGLAAHAEEKQAEPKKQTVCPVMGGKINKAQFVDVDGKRIYVCCAGCKGKIQADPEKYIKQLKKEGIALDAAATSQDTPSNTEEKQGCCG